MLRPYHDLHVSSHDISGYVINRFTGTERKLYRPGRPPLPREVLQDTYFQLEIILTSRKLQRSTKLLYSYSIAISQSLSQGALCWQEKFY